MNGLWYVLLVVLILVLLLGVQLGGAEVFNPQEAAAKAAEAIARVEAMKAKAAIDLMRYEREAMLKAELWGWPARFLIVATGFAVLLIGVCVGYYFICLGAAARENAERTRRWEGEFSHMLEPDDGDRQNGDNGKRDDIPDMEKIAAAR